MFIEFETVKSEKVCINVNSISLFCKKKENTTLVCIGDYVEIEVKGDYGSVCRRMQRRELLPFPSLPDT